MFMVSSPQWVNIVNHAKPATLRELINNNKSLFSEGNTFSIKPLIYPLSLQLTTKNTSVKYKDDLHKIKNNTSIMEHFHT